MTTQAKDLSIIILNFNTAEWVTKCLHSVEKLRERMKEYSIEVVVVDNASSDDSPKVIKKTFPWVKLIVSERNLGFAGGNNLALKEAKTRYVMLLNSDTEFPETSTLSEALKYMDDNTSVGVLTPKVVLATGGLDMASHRGEPTPWASFTYFSKLAKLFPKSQLFAQYHQTYKDFTKIHQIDACSGAAMIVRTTAMKEVGYLDEQFFMYAEDLDWCKRFREQGYAVVYYPLAEVIHYKYKSGLQNKNQTTAKKTNAHFYDTMLQYYDKHYRHRYPSFVRSLIKLLISLKKGA